MAGSGYRKRRIDARIPQSDMTLAPTLTTLRLTTMLPKTLRMQPEGPLRQRMRIPTLDGWRGVAILLVLVYHYELFFHNHPFWNCPFFAFGHHGVNIFFVLSGFVVTWTLRQEEKICLSGFYIRRFFRLMPAAWTYFLLLALLTAITSIKFFDKSVWSCLFFLSNDVPHYMDGTYTGQFWSLSLEEQFYIFWPPVLVCFGRRGGLFVSSLGAVAVAIYRYLHWSQYARFGIFMFFRTEVRADGLFVGCLLALLLEYSAAQRFFLAYGRWIIISCILPLMIDFYRFQTVVPLHENILIALMIGSTALNPTLLWGRILEFKYLKTTGMLSYGIYLWQGVFWRPMFGTLMFILLPTAVLASWCLIEKPSMALGRKLEARLRAAQRKLTGTLQANSDEMLT